MNNKSTRLNGVCPYFTMFPLEFPVNVLASRAVPGQKVLDPFSGRGTTNYASRLLGLESYGIDSSKVASALTAAKLANCSPESIVRTARQILSDCSDPRYIPKGEFWERAFHPRVLKSISVLRESLIDNCSSPSRIALRAIVMGALHGPINKTVKSYLSNQSPRTFAPKPKYAVGYWDRHRMTPPQVDVLELIKNRARRFFSDQPKASGRAITGDSRESRSFESIRGSSVDWIVTSPPYYGMNTYIPDQWLRNWFVGGPSDVDYRHEGQLDHPSPSEFADQLRSVWKNVAAVAKPTARMVVRFGGVPNRTANTLEIAKQSFNDSGWRLETITDAGTADKGRRQISHFGRNSRSPKIEYDIWAIPS